MLNVQPTKSLSVDPVDLRLHLPELDFGTGSMQWVKLALSHFILNVQPTNKRHLLLTVLICAL